MTKELYEKYPFKLLNVDRLDDEDEFLEEFDRYCRDYAYDISNPSEQEAYRKLKNLKKLEERSGALTPHQLGMMITEHFPVIRVIKDRKYENARVNAYDVNRPTNQQDAYIYCKKLTGYEWLNIESIRESLFNIESINHSENNYRNFKKAALDLVHKMPTLNLSSVNKRNIIDGKFEGTVLFEKKAYNLQTKEFEEYKPSDFAETRGIRCYDALDYTQAESEKFETYFKNLSNGSKQREKFLLQIATAAILRYNPQMKIINFVGRAGSGKTTLMNLLSNLWGYELGDDGHADISYQDMKNQESNKLTYLIHYDLIMHSDNGDKVYIEDNSNLKRLTGRDTLSVKSLYKDPVLISFTGLILQGMNKMPKINNSSSQQILDRMRFIHLNNRVRKTSQAIDGIDEDVSKFEFVGKIAKWILDRYEAFTDFVDIEEDSELLEEEFKEGDPTYAFLQYYRKSGLLDSNIILTPVSKALYDNFFDEEIGQDAGKPIQTKHLNEKVGEYVNGIRPAKNYKERKRIKSLEKNSGLSALFILKYIEAYYGVEIDVDYQNNQMINAIYNSEIYDKSIQELKEEISALKDTNDESEKIKLRGRILALISKSNLYLANHNRDEGNSVIMKTAYLDDALSQIQDDYELEEVIDYDDLMNI